MTNYICRDCKRSIIVNPNISEPTISHCMCVDRETNPDKKSSNVVYVYDAVFIPSYLRGNKEIK